MNKDQQLIAEAYEDMYSNEDHLTRLVNSGVDVFCSE